MRAFGGGNSAAQPTAGSQPKKEELLAAMKEQADLQVGQSYVKFSTKLCLNACTKKPSDRFSAHERKCIETCTTRYIEGAAIVAHTIQQYTAALHRDHQH